MSRSHGPATNSGWPTQRRPSPEQEADALRGAPQGQRPDQANAQAPQAAGYPQGGYPQQPGYHFPQQSPAAPEYESYPATQPPYAQQGHTQPQQPGFAPGGFDPHAHHPTPYPQAGSYPAEHGQLPEGRPDLRGAHPDQWQASTPAQDPRGYDLGSYMPAGTHSQGTQYHGDPHQQQAEWGHPGHGEAVHEQAYHGGPLGYEQAQPGALDQSYAQEEGGEYELEEPRRGSWTMRIAGAVVVAIGLGYGLAQAYKLVLGSSPDGATPLVKGNSAPAKIKPTDPGGKHFAHTDSKIMGRLGENTDSSNSTGSLSDSDVDANGARKVTTVTVGRDGSIVPPAAPGAAASAEPTITVPGMTVVDGFGGRPPASAFGSTQGSPVIAAAKPAAPVASPQKPVVVNPPASSKKPVVVTTLAPTKKSTQPPPAQKSAALTANAAPAASAPAARAPVTKPSVAGNGYVVVLASVPASDKSRLAALKRYADMRQKYGSVLQNRTPDVKEADLGEKGTYHRLVVGPPGSRAQASALCSQLKTAGYKDCWVTAY